jgi:hypothetical protein
LRSLKKKLKSFADVEAQFFLENGQKFASFKNADLDQDFPFGEFSDSGNIIIHGNRVQRILVEKMSHSL